MTTNTHIRMVQPDKCCTHDCSQGRNCPRRMAEAVARAAAASERAKRAREMREHYRPPPWYYRVDWIGILQRWGAAIIFVSVIAAGSSLDYPQR